MNSYFLCSFFYDHLKKFSNVFISTQNNSHIMLHSLLKTPNERTKAVGDVVECLGEEVIPGIRKEVLLQITKIIYWLSSFLQRVALCYRMFSLLNTIYFCSCITLLKLLGAQISFLSFFFLTLLFASLMDYFLRWFSSAISCCTIFWGTGIFFAGTCSSSLFWDKGWLCLYISHTNCFTLSEWHSKAALF